ncbi:MULTISPECIES: hypothetical protein [Aneurinibacillus]|uniref:Uncharacterized protein n=1 Tax=Aneurinibacillus thermoaerophilus TaxID=143495 RepID=A0A1G8BX08_ANETH|nr:MULTISPECIES: hypothetical protein [Aneurinibacillus]AMA71999.1 hypothetical protein ACH33_03510 [Aneurinibacillus sp. XH2]MED0675130.1 hypothetical protein [Aneurinibacillus thermoaerophilus]MED0679279.1 hypothetical protein [Aneurinibacillus thermoaerophilus]MED0737165.1 hypothetical protein [Aneurinibacillus thermoaerophilus]MED0757211.1 hypothetical protein [Aneurinibacillus thermoaerophilus]
MSISIGENRAAFAAYTKLTLVSRFQNQINGIQPNTQSKTSMGFPEFMERLRKNEVVNEKYARTILNKQREDSLINSRYNGNPQFESEKLSFIEKAYNLGIVDEYGTLINTRL